MRDPDAGRPHEAVRRGLPDHSCTRSEIDETYVLRRVGQHWRILYNHFSPRDHGAFWDAFWNRK